IETWLPQLPLHTILTTLSVLFDRIPSADTSTDTPAALAALRTIDPSSLPLEPSPIRIHLFEWSALSLGWYESLLWGFIFTSELSVSKGSSQGVWNGTGVKLFRVQEGPVQTPSLLAPRGAVDAVGSNLVQRIGSLGVRAGQVARGGVAGGGGGANPRVEGGATVRDV
ncbi:hypothetical protein LTS18_007286, partial [Coniosporium uncinatum]